MKRKGHHGGAWKVAYADFVTAMMALFLVLWLTSQDRRIKQAVERAFRNPFSAVNKQSTGIIPSKHTSLQHKVKGNFQSVNAVEMEMLRHVTEDLAKILQSHDNKTVQLQLTPDGLRINVFDRSHKPIFKPDTAVFTTYGAWVFSTLAWEISRYHTFKIELEGHTETSPPGSVEAREKWDLSTERANAARQKLVECGVLPRQIYKVSGYADTKPMPGTAPSDEINRRVTVLLKVQEPGFETGSTHTSNANNS